MKTAIENPNVPHNGKTMAGIIILIIGSILLIDQLDLFFIPHWLFSWPMWIIAYGLYLGGKYNFKKKIWMWMVVIGTAFLFTENIRNADNFVWPVAIIGVGTWMVLKHNRRVDADYTDTKYKEV
jgi:predicted membrane protein